MSSEHKNIDTATPLEAAEPKGKVEKKGGKRIGYNYIILKSLKEHPKNDVVKCIYIKSFINFGVCVIKEGTAGELKDVHGRDIKDRLLWQKELHQQLQGKVNIPRYIGSFEENGNYYLAIEHLKGITFGQLCREHGEKMREGLISGNKLGIRLLGYLLKIVKLLDNLHKLQIVHRDVTSGNFIISKYGRISLIDLELAYSLKLEAPQPPFTLGTYGYMSPEQLKISIPTIKEDIYSAGAILLQAWTGISPAKLTGAPDKEMLDKINFFIPDLTVADVVYRCLHADAAVRPSLQEVFDVLKKYKDDKKRCYKRATQHIHYLDKEYIKSTIQSAIQTLSSPLLSDVDQGWFSEDQRMFEKRDQNKMYKNWYCSYNVGGTGVMYFLAKVHAAGFDIEATKPNILATLSLIEKKYIKSQPSFSAGLLAGSYGIAAGLAVLQQHGIIDRQYDQWIDDLFIPETYPRGIGNGIAGKGLALLIARHASADLGKYVNELINSQSAEGAWYRYTDVNIHQGRITKGFAHGMAGIIFFLMEYFLQYQDQNARKSADAGLQWLINNAILNQHSIEWLSSEGQKITPWVHDGAPGIALAFIKAYEATQNPIYRKYATGALLVHPEHVINYDLSQENGLAGLGEVYLEAYRVLRDEQWLDRATWIAQLLMRMKKVSSKYGPYWLVGDEKQPVAGFQVGNAGILHFLSRYCFPEKLTFPLAPDGNTAKFHQKVHLTNLYTI